MSLTDFRNQLRYNPPILPDLFWLAYNSVVRAACAGVAPNAQLPGMQQNFEALYQDWINNVTSYVALNGKFSKFEAAYLPFSPPPLFWDYKCRKCRFYIPVQIAVAQAPGPQPQCTLVDGDISPSAWCSLWMAPDTYKAFSWPSELLAGNW
jgi:hypothetical protein